MKVLVSPEYALLVEAAVPRGFAPDAAPTGQPPIRWARLMDLARWHRLAPLLWRHLRQAGDAIGVPDAICDQLWSEALGTTARNLLLQATLEPILASMAQEDIPAMLLKGSALVEAVYPDIALRPMDDIDILVPSSSIRRAHQVVEALGYRVMGTGLKRDDDRKLNTHYHHFPLVSPTGAVMVELHHHITFAGPQFDIAGYWERAVPGDGVSPHLLPAPEDLFLHVAVHFSADRIARRTCALGQLADLAWIATRWCIDWEEMGRRAVLYGQGHRLFLALMAMDTLFAGVVPTALLAALQPMSYRRERGEQFVQHLVLRSRLSSPIEQIASGRMKLCPRPTALDGYVRLDESPLPSVANLRLRRAVQVARRTAGTMVGPRELLADVRLSRWINSL